MRIPVLLFLLFAMDAARAGSPVSWSFAAAPATGDTVAISLTAACEPGWHIYALTLPSDQGPLPTVITVQDDKAYHVAGPAKEPGPEEKDDPNFGMVVRFHTGVVTFVQPLLRAAGPAFTVKGKAEYMACNDKTCLPPVSVPFELAVPASR